MWTGLTACALWTTHLVFSRALEQRQCRRSLYFLGLAQAVSWTTSGALLASAAQFPPWQCHGVLCRADAIVNAVAAWTWVIAGVLMTCSALGLLRPTRRFECIIMVLWSISAAGLMVATLISEVRCGQPRAARVQSGRSARCSSQRSTFKSSHRLCLADAGRGQVDVPLKLRLGLARLWLLVLHDLAGRLDAQAVARFGAPAPAPARV
jgi:hypothetical protein